jgi:diphthamide biosynthesis enzyme Dph1/Dph2-like protein
MYDLELGRAKKEIKRTNAKKVLVQLPAGLANKAIKIVKELRKTGAEIILWAGSNYGACDLAEYKECDLLLHFGHEEMK